MQVKHLALAAITLAGTAFAQCGANQLTTPPNFVTNNGGGTGGAVYFTLDVLAANGVSICGIDITTSVAAGTALSGGVYIHNTITDVNQLTSLNGSGEWCHAGNLSGISNGTGTGSPMSISNSGTSLDLPPGQYLVAVGNGNWNNQYTNGNGCNPGNQCIADANLGFVGGKASNVSFTGGLFNPRVGNFTFDYDVPAVPITAAPGCAGSCETVGVACGGSPFQVYELFDTANLNDLSGNDLLLDTANGVVAVPSTAITVPAPATLYPLGDDQSTVFIPLATPLTLGGNTFTEISVCSNGYIRFDGNSPPGDFTHSAAELENEGARLAMYWTDMNPSLNAAGGVYIDDVGPSTVVTFDQVYLFGTTTPMTFQVEMIGGVVILRYDPNNAWPNDSLVGYSNGLAPAAPGTSADLTGGPTGPITGAGDLLLSCDQAPSLGGSMDMTLSNNPSLGAVLAQIGHVAAPGALLGLPFGPTCEQYIGAVHVSLGITNQNVTAYSIGVPNVAVFLGLPFGCQGASLGAGTFSASNGVNGTVGGF